MTKLNGIIACEFSQVIASTFRRAGHNVYSCDLKPCLKDSSYHIQDTIFNHLKGWDFMIAHPECTYLTVAGARWFAGREREQKEAIDFAERLWECGIPKIAIENPIGVLSTRSILRKPTQIIQPWMFGHGETKATCLWLKGFPKLVPTNIVSGRVPRVHYESPGIINGMTRQERRSITLQGIANAMVEQWSNA